jgi:hypothetical protein
MGSYDTGSRIYTVDYKIKGDKRKISLRTIKMEKFKCTLNPEIGRIAHARTASRNSNTLDD